MGDNLGNAVWKGVGRKRGEEGGGDNDLENAVWKVRGW